jgi:hypothetical protein
MVTLEAIIFAHIRDASVAFPHPRNNPACLNITRCWEDIELVCKYEQVGGRSPRS